MIENIYRIADKYENVFVCTTCRTSDSSAFIKMDTRYGIVAYEVPEITDKEIDCIAAQYPIIGELKKQEKYRELLQIPFYINLIVSGEFSEKGIDNENSFRYLIWEKVICLKGKAVQYGVTQSKIKDVIENIVFTRAEKFVVGIDRESIDNDALNALVSEGIVVCTDGKVRLRYDIFEDICFEIRFDKEFDECRGDYKRFFECIKNSGRCVYRRYQIWISNKLFVKNSRQKFVYELLVNREIDEKWKKQTEIGIVKSKYSGLFFDEFQNLLDEDVIYDLVCITNLYAFEARLSHTPALSLELYPIGTARENLLLSISQDMYSNEEYKLSLIKLCDDYSRYEDKKVDVERKACEILICYINEFIEKDTTKELWMYTKEIVNLFLIISRMAKVSKDWLTNFVSLRIEEFTKEYHGIRSLAEAVLEAILSNQDSTFVEELPVLACKVADAFWLKQESNDNSIYFVSDLYMEDDFGLSRNANHLSNASQGVYSNPFIWHIMHYDFIYGLNWAISFVNSSISYYVERNSEGIESINIFFPDTGTIKTYYGNGSMWIADSAEHNIPIILTDIIYAIKRTIINTIRNSDDKEYNKKLAEYVRQTLYDRANNVVLLSIIEAIGMNFRNELPGYALELASSVELIYYDAYRYRNYVSNPTAEIIKKQMLLAVGIPELPDRYIKDDACVELLSIYFSKAIYGGSQSVKEKCSSILEYLYSKYDEKNYPNENLQIQKMDFRNLKTTELESGLVLIEPELSGSAKEIVENYEKSQEPVNSLNAEISNTIKLIIEKNATEQQIVESIKLLEAEMEKDHLMDMHYEESLVILIMAALMMPNLKLSHRNHIVDIWINRAYKIVENDSYVAGIDTLRVLWKQLETDIDTRLKEKILKMMLQSILNDGHNGVVNKASLTVEEFLKIQPEYAERFFNTILKLAEDEMNHQKYNAEYANLNCVDEEFSFAPNRVPSLKGIDYQIKEKKDSGYVDHEEQILEKYLFNKSDDAFTTYCFDNCDVRILCYLVKCGICISDTRMSTIMKDILNCFIDVLNDSDVSFHIHEIIGIHSEYMISRFLRAAIIEDDKHELVYSLLFNGVEFSHFKRETVDFYREVLDFLCAYVDGHLVNGRRSNIENKIICLEKCVSAIEVEWVKNELKKSLFLCPAKYDYWDINKVNTKYDYWEKQFINKQIKTYGTHDLNSVICTVYLMKIEELLPEVLLSISICFSQAMEDSVDVFTRCVAERQAIIEQIILESFVYNSEKIKNDTELIEAYENILQCLVKIRNEKAAVLLDEFRVH